MASTEEKIRKRVLTTVEEMRPEIVKLAQDLIRTRSIVSEEQNTMANFVAAKMRELGLKVDFVGVSEDRPNTVGWLKGSEGKRALGFYSHYDTMPVEDPSAWITDPWGGEVRQGKIYGVGSADCKAGIAAALGMVGALKRSGIKLKGDLCVTACLGEVGNLDVGMSEVIKKGLFKVNAAVQGDPTPSDTVNSITSHHLGILWCQLVIRGKPGHSLIPEQAGVNPVTKLPLILRALEKLKIPHRPYKIHPEHPYVMFDEVKSGPSFPGFSTINGSISFRVHLLPNQDKGVALKSLNAQIKQLEKENEGLDLELVVRNWEHGDEVGDWPETAELLKTVERASLMVMGKRPKKVVMSAPAMAKYVVRARIPSLVWAPSAGFNSNTHRANEWVGVEDLINFTKGYCMVAMDYLRYEQKPL